MSDGERARPARASGVTLHLTPADVWLAQFGARAYVPEAFAVEGFVHCTDGEPFVLDVGNRYYRDDPRPYVLLDVDLSRVAARAVYGDDARHYPHVHGPIERAAVVRVRRVTRAADGTFVGIGGDAPPSAVD